MPSRVGPPQIAPLRLRGSIIVDTYRGKVRVRSWKGKLKRPLHPHTTYMNTWFKDACRKIKYADSRAVDFSIKAAKGTGLYPRDILMASMAGGLVDIDLPDGTPVTYKRQGLHPVSFQGIRLQLATNFSVPNGVSTLLLWPIPVVDTAGMFNGASPGRITIPPGINMVRLSGCCMSNITNNTRVALWILRNGSQIVAQMDSNSSPWSASGVDSGPLPVTSGDYFELWTFINAARTFPAGPQNNFCAEILDADYPNT